jgi:hypothetical protein
MGKYYWNSYILLDFKFELRWNEDVKFNNIDDVQSNNISVELGLIDVTCFLSFYIIFKS